MESLRRHEIRDFTQRKREAFTKAFATERDWGDNLGPSTVEVRNDGFQEDAFAFGAKCKTGNIRAGNVFLGDAACRF